MARGKIPDPLSRRHLVERDLDAARALAIAEAYLAEGRRVEALEFLAKADARERLESIGREAVEEGDVFLARAAAGLLGIDIDAATWRALAEAAGARGKPHYEAEAARQAAAREG